MMIAQNSVMNLLIGKNIARTGGVQITDPSAATYIADGEVVVCDASGTVLNTTTVANKNSIYLVQGQGANKPLIWSDEIFKSSVRTFTGKAYTAGTVQIDYIGYDATTNSGAIDVISDNDYTIELFDVDSTTFGTTGYAKQGFYTSDASATQREIAIGLTESLFTNTRDLVFPAVKIEMVCDSSSTFTAFAANAVVVNGSKVVTITNTTGITVGSLVRLGSTASDLDAVYEVDAVVTNTSITLNYPYQGASATLLTASNFCGVLTNVTNYGIRVTGRSPFFTAPNLTTYHVNRWKTVLYRSGSTPVTTPQKATEGSGEAAQISYLEYFLLGNEGHSAREGVVPQVNPRSNTESTGTYSIIALSHARKEPGTVMEQPTSHKQLMIAFNKLGGFVANSQANNATTTSVETVLENWLSSFPAISI